MCSECSSLNDIKPLENWNVSNGTNFLFILNGCSYLKDIRPLENWNVSNGTNFKGIFNRCLSLNDIEPLEKWKLSGNNLKVCSIWVNDIILWLN